MGFCSDSASTETPDPGRFSLITETVRDRHLVRWCDGSRSRNGGLRLLIARRAKEEQSDNGRNGQTDDDREEPVDPADMDVEH